MRACLRVRLRGYVRACARACECATITAAATEAVTKPLNIFDVTLPWRLAATDGSGGVHSSCPILRRCGWGVVELWAPGGWGDFEGMELSLATWGPLPGHKQTVYRAELFAVVVLLKTLLEGNIFNCGG